LILSIINGQEGFEVPVEEGEEVIDDNETF